jgi:hypothetical protein
VYTLKFNLIIFCSILIACSNNSSRQSFQKNQATGENVIKSIQYKIFTLGDKGFGFDILKNEKIYIHQPFIPSWQGIHPFPSYESAKVIARYVSNKLKKNSLNFLIQKEDVDSLLKGYYSVRKDTGLYDESVCYPLQYNGTWEFYQECSAVDCYLGAQFKVSENLGDLCYTSYFAKERRIEIKDIHATNKNMFLFPRSFAVMTEKQPIKPVYIRFFFSKIEIEKGLQQVYSETGIHFLPEDILVLQYNDKGADTEPFNNKFEQKKYLFIHPLIYTYGYNAEIFVAEISVLQLSSEFYLALSLK